MTPDTFEIPSEEARHSLGFGDHAKLIFEAETDTGRVAERLWVLATGRSGDRYTGQIAGDPVNHFDITLADTIEFGPEHIAAIDRNLK
jgi:hypothetical protein